LLRKICEGVAEGEGVVFVMLLLLGLDVVGEGVDEDGLETLREAIG